MLRGATRLPTPETTYPHTNQTMRLRMEFMDAEYNFQASGRFMQAWAALHAHKDAKLADAFNVLKSLYAGSIGTLQYMTGGRSGEELANDDRAKFVEAYRKIRERAEKPDRPAQAASDRVAIFKVGRH